MKSRAANEATLTLKIFIDLSENAAERNEIDKLIRKINQHYKYDIIIFI